MNLKIFLLLNIDEVLNIKIPHKNKSLSLFRINACFLNKNFDNLQHLLSCIKKHFDIIAISETRITKQVSLLNNLNLNNYSFEFTLTETSAGGTLLYIANLLSHNCRNDLNIYKKNELESTFSKIFNPKKLISLWESFTDIHLYGGLLTSELRVASYELRVTIYCTSYELLFTYELRVITYSTSYELIFTYELRVITFCTSYQLLFIYELRVVTYCTSYELLFTYELRVITYSTSYELIFTYELRATIYWTSYKLN